MRYFFYLLTISLLILSFILEGGYLAVLFQPIEFLGVIICSLFLLASKYGFKNTLNTLFKGIGNREFVRDGVLISLFLSLFMLIAGIIITFGRLSHGYEVMGHSIAASLVSLLYGIIQIAYILTINHKENV